MSERVFIDTNVFVYAHDTISKAKRERARAVLAPLILARRAVLSTQVMQEYFIAATKKLKMSPARARTRIETLNRLDVVVIRPELIAGAIDLHRLHSISFWDALIIRAASASGCGTVLTEDLNHGQIIDGVRIENPFATGTRASESKSRYQTSSRRRRTKLPL